MKFLILFVNTLGRLSFREAELRALLELSNCEHAPARWTRENDPTGQESVFMEESFNLRSRRARHLIFNHCRSIYHLLMLQNPSQTDQ